MRTSRATVIVLLLLVPGLCPGVLPLRDQWAAACAAMAAGRAGEAMAALDEFDAWYAAEAAVREPAFREGYLRLKGLTALQAGRVAEGVELLEQWLAEYPRHPRYRAFIRFQAGAARHSLGSATEAVSHWRSFLQEHADLPECALVRWMWADLLVAAGGYAEARDHLLAILQEQRLPPSGHALARAALALVELQEGNRAQAADWLRPAAADQDGVLALWRGLLAPSLAQQLLESEQPDAAAEAAGWFDLPHNLAARLPQLPAGTGGRAMPARQAIWNSHWAGQLQRLRAALDGTGKEAVPLADLYALRLNILLRNKSAVQAGILADGLLRTRLPELAGMRAGAYAGAIEAAHLLRDWPKAEALAAEFAAAFPQDPELPRILFLQAQTAAGRKDLQSAIRQVDQLIAARADHKSRPSWELVGAGWRLEAGEAAAALDVLRRLESESPAGWHPFIRFQQARCHEALKQTAEAVALHEAVAALATASQPLREQALIGLLKIHMGAWDWPAFDRALARYRSSWPDGMNRLMVENLAATAHLQRGDLDQAVTLFGQVAAADSPLADYAREQLSAIHRGGRDPEPLRAHAVAWIRQHLAGGRDISATPFLDAGLCQRQSGRPALPVALVQSLLERAAARPAAIPVSPLLELLEDQWPAYTAGLGGGELAFAQWVRARAGDFLIQDNRAPHAAFQLHAAFLLERQGRPDSADALRIEVLKNVDPALLDPHGLQTVAETASRYDFPEAGDLLRLFLRRYPESDRRPAVLVRLAALLRRTGDSGDALPLLGEILADWPDAPVHSQACLLQAQWLIADGRAAEALGPLGVLLDKPRLEPVQAAQALLLRARADFAGGDPARGLLDCRRVLTLYPAFGDIARETAGLLLASVSGLPDPALLPAARELVLSAIPDYPLPPNA